MSAIDEFVKNNEAFAEAFDKGDLPLPPVVPGAGPSADRLTRSCDPLPNQSDVAAA